MVLLEQTVGIITLMGTHTFTMYVQIHEKTKDLYIYKTPFLISCTLKIVLDR